MFANTGNDAIVDEYTFGGMQDSAVALSALQTHWETVRSMFFVILLWTNMAAVDN
jgi:hypothetical protein